VVSGYLDTQGLDDGEIKSFWNLAGLSYDTAMALKLQLLLAQRIGEIVGMMWSEVDFSENLWTIPKDRVKNKTVHTVPLNRTAVALLQDRRPSNAAPSDFVFLSKKPGKHIRTDSIGTALARALKNTDIEHFSSHDLRRTAATRISGLGVSREVLRQILNHKDLDVTGRYDRYKYDSEKRVVLQEWDDYLQDIIL
jgi:integrase